MGETFRWRNGVFYWVNGSNVVRLNGSTVEAVTSSGDVAGFFEVDDDAVYYLATADAGLSIRRTKLDRSSTVTVAPDVRGIFALNGDRIYFDASDGRFVSTSKLGGGSIDPVAGPPSVEPPDIDPPSISGLITDPMCLLLNARVLTLKLLFG